MGAYKMKNVVLLTLVLLLFVPGFSAVITTDIEGVRLRTDGGTAELTSADREVVEGFWKTALSTMHVTEDVQEIVAIRRQIEGQRSSQPLCSYAGVFTEAALKYIPLAFQQSQKIQDEARRRLFNQNLMVLTASLQSPKVASIAIERLADPDPVIRYWAVKAVTNPGVILSLSDDITADDKIKTAILTALKSRVSQETMPEAQAMIIQFAASLNHPDARQILQSIAEMRMAAYKTWTVQNEALDAKLLVAMGNIAMMQSDPAVKSLFAQKFSELYSLAFQRYLLGEKVLTASQVDQTLSVIAEVDEAILGKMLDTTQTGILNALKQKRGLDRIYETLFGDRLRAGELATAFKFDYGKDASGKPVTQPPVLSVPAAADTNVN